MTREFIVVAQINKWFVFRFHFIYIIFSTVGFYEIYFELYVEFHNFWTFIYWTRLIARNCIDQKLLHADFYFVRFKLWPIQIYFFVRVRFKLFWIAISLLHARTNIEHEWMATKYVFVCRFVRSIYELIWSLKVWSTIRTHYYEFEILLIDWKFVSHASRFYYLFTFSIIIIGFDCLFHSCWISIEVGFEFHRHACAYLMIVANMCFNGCHSV